MTGLPPPIASRCAQIIGQISSKNEGTVIAASRALVRTLETAGLGITDLSEHITSQPRETIRYLDRAPKQAPPAYPFGAWRDASCSPGSNSRHRHLVARCQSAHRSSISTWEVTFLANVGRRLDRGITLTPKQAATLRGIAERLGVSAA